MRRKAVSAWSMVAAAALVLSACSGGGSGDNGSGQNASTDVNTMKTGKAESGDNYKLANAPESDQVTVAIDDSFTAYNQNTPDANTSYNSFVLITTLATPYVLDGDNKVLLNQDVMDSVTVTQNPQVVTWKVKPNVKWSDGATWGCKDFYLAWLAQSGKPKGADGKAAFDPASTSGYSLISDAQCKDETTFVATFEKPYLDYKGLFTTAWMMPAHIVEKQTGVADISKVKPTDAADIGKVAEFWNKGWAADFKPELSPASGPYKITAVDKSKETVTLEKNPTWAGAKGGPKKILVRAIKDRNAMASALQNGEIDVAASTQPDNTAADKLKGLASQGVVYGSASQLSFEHLDLNYKRIFADESARKAFMAAIDRNEIVDKLVKNVQADAKPLSSLQFYPNEAGYVDLYSDKAGLGAEKAAKILTDAGWAKGPDGIFAKDGKRFSVTITHNTNARRTKTVEIIQSQAKLAGIEVKEETDPNFLKGRVSDGGYDVALFAWSAAPFKAEASTIYITADKGGEQNWQGLSDPKIDEALQRAVSATDESAATKAYQDADKAIADQHASLPLFAVPSMWAFRGIDRVWMQSYFGAMWNVGEWAKTNK
ncbi:ABC transporter family substrate-binding protein [Amycolatopsis sp. NPDC059657]|uniref:ABC transporter family substrate-binding protein n=1 Tax=Amycolatopsis sp. NPDC059657 TaxID=3346899 RepID=UPI00366B6417